MIKPLSTAKLRSVREIKRKAKVKKVNKLVTTIVVVVLLLVIFFFSLSTFVLGDDFSISNLFSSRKEYKETELGITFISYDFPVMDAVKSLENDSNITIFYGSPSADEDYLSEITDLVYIYPAVFSARGKRVTIVIGLLDNRGNTISCVSNLGDIYTNEELSFEKCKELIEKDQTLIIINAPNERLRKSEVLLNVKEKTISLASRNMEDLHISSYLLLKGMYEEFEDIMKKINEFKIDQLPDINQ